MLGAAAVPARAGLLSLRCEVGEDAITLPDTCPVKRDLTSGTSIPSALFISFRGMLNAAVLCYGRVTH